MNELKDLTGMRFGRLVILKEIDRTLKRCRRFESMCDCGTISQNNYPALISGDSQSCGCLYRETRLGNKKHGEGRPETITTEYRSWAAMKNRCSNPKRHDYHHYGGRGITVCEEWANSFKCFLKDMGRKPSPKHSLDRFPNKNGNYEPSNCRWATQKEQMRNVGHNVMIAINGVSKCLAEWSESSPVNSGTIKTRIKAGWEPEKAIFQPARKLTKHEPE